jgi:hypothetical protein
LVTALEEAHWRPLMAVSAALAAVGVLSALAGAYALGYAVVVIALGAAALFSGPAACVAIALTSPLVGLGSAPLGFHVLIAYPLIAAGVAGAIWRADWRGLRLRLSDGLLVAFAGVATIVSLANTGLVPDTPVVGATGANAPQVRSLAQLAAVIAMAALYLLFRVELRRPAQLYAVLRGFVVAGAGVALYAAYQVAGRALDLPYTFVNERRSVATLPTEGYIRVNSTLPEASPLAQFSAALLLVGIAWCLARTRPAWLSRKLALVIAAVAGAVLAATLSKAGWLAAALTIVPLLIATVPRQRLPLALAGAALAIAAAFVALVVFRGSGDIFNGGLVDSERYLRTGYWITAVDIARANPFGIGIGNFAFYYPDFAPVSQRYEFLPGIADAHNIFLEMLAESGILGGLLFAGFVLSLVVDGAAAGLRARARTPFLAGTALALVAAFATGCLMHLTYSYFYYPFEWVVAGCAGCAAAMLRHATARAA